MPEESDPTPDPPPPDQPTLLGNLAPDELFARAMQTVKMTSGAAGTWEPPSLEEAARLFPRYEVLKLLGRGGMGAVYQARQIELDRLVAIKLLPLEISVDQDFADRFRREARAMAKLHHPNIITVFDFGTTPEGHLFFVMEFVEGANLQDLIHDAESAALSPEQALSIVEQVCTALAYAHGKGIVHRDIKPANVMIDLESQAKVADFGLARLTDPSAEQLGHTVTGTVMGTPDYMSPEQLQGMNVDERADIYSLGVMLYEMLCRQVPRGIFQPPSHRTGCDERIDRIVIKAMQQAPDHRYRSTTEMKADVIDARTPLVIPSAATQEVRPRPVDPPALREPKAAVSKAIAPPAEKKSKLLLSGGISLAIVAASLIAIFVSSRPKPSAPEPQAEPSAARVTRLASTNAAALEPGAIQLWDAREKIPQSPDIAWKDDALFITKRGVVHTTENRRDLVVSFSVRLIRGAEGLKLAVRNIGTASEPRQYQLHVTPATGLIAFRLETSEGVRTLKQWSFPQAYSSGEWMPRSVCGRLAGSSSSPPRAKCWAPSTTRPFSRRALCFSPLWPMAIFATSSMRRSTRPAP